MDLNQKAPDSNITNPTSEAAPTVQKKTCAACNTTKTPLWRSGPAGPRSLCNACGIRNRKARRALLGLPKGGSEKIKKTKKMKKSQSHSQSQSQSSNSSSSSNSNSDEMSASLKLDQLELQRLMGRKLMEEEEAAMLLMALSCDSILA